MAVSAATRRGESTRDHASGRHAGRGGGSQDRGSPSPVVGFIDGQWVSGGTMGQEDADNGTKDAAAAGLANKAGDSSTGKPAAAVAAVAAAAAEGTPSSGHPSGGVGPYAMPSTAAAAVSVAGQAPRRPRWDKAKPAAIAAAAAANLGLGAAVAKASENAALAKKKLVWGGGGGGAGGVKRTLWSGGAAAGKGAGGAASSGQAEKVGGWRVFFLFVCPLFICCCSSDLSLFAKSGFAVPTLGLMFQESCSRRPDRCGRLTSRKRPGDYFLHNAGAPRSPPTYVWRAIHFAYPSHRLLVLIGLDMVSCKTTPLRGLYRR